MRLNINQLVKAIVASTLMTFAFGSSAALITGDVTFSGNWDSVAGTATTTELTFPGGDVDADDSTGDFSGIAEGDLGTISTLDFGVGGPLAGTFVSLGGFDFSLTDVSVVFQSATIIILEGSGVASGNGFDDTIVDFFFTANQNGGLKAFSAGFTAQPVPVPGALILFGSALAGLAVRRSK
ncbi:MAG: PEP-CTERM sorting domain-containing protein [Gammaproteobacteria bacterium]